MLSENSSMVSLPDIISGKPVFETPVEKLGQLINKENGAVLAKDDKGEHHIVTKYDVIQSLAQ